MKTIITILILIYSSIILLSVAEEFPYRSQGTGVSEFFSEVSVEQRNALAFLYGIEPYGFEKFGVSLHTDRQAVAGSRSIAEDCFSLLNDDRLFNYWGDAFNTLGIMASVDHSRVDFERLTEAVRRLEGSSDVRKNHLARILSLAYRAVGRFGFEKSAPFLVPRMSEEFWEGKRRFEQNYGSRADPFMIPAPQFAISGFTILGEEGSIDVVYTLLENGRIANDYLGSTKEYIDSKVEVLVPRRRESHKRHVELYQKWREETNTANGPAHDGHECEGDIDEHDGDSDATEPETGEEGRHAPPDAEEETAGAELIWMFSGAVVIVSAGAVW